MHRHHLHCGLVEGAKRHGAKIITNARVAKIEYETSPVRVTTVKGVKYEFDLLIGSDGLKSVVRNTLFPDVKPRAATHNAAYRAIVPYEEMWRRVPESREFGNSIDVWSVEKGYVITYPISGGRDWNTVLSHYFDRPVTDVEEDVDMDKVKAYFKDIDPRLKKVIDIIPKTKRWPLLITGPLKSWSSPQKNVVLMGDAAHSMQNHMAQVRSIASLRKALVLMHSPGRGNKHGGWSILGSSTGRRSAWSVKARGGNTRVRKDTYAAGMVQATSVVHHGSHVHAAITDG